MVAKDETCCVCGEMFISGGIFPQHICDRCQIAQGTIVEYKLNKCEVCNDKKVIGTFKGSSIVSMPCPKCNNNNVIAENKV
jgi:hypothetical protein